MKNRHTELERKLYYKSKEWIALRECVYERDHYRCKRCKRVRTKDRYLQCHHLTYERFRKEWLIDLVSVCRECHGSESYSPTIIHPLEKIANEIIGLEEVIGSLFRGDYTVKHLPSIRKLLLAPVSKIRKRIAYLKLKHSSAKANAIIESNTFWESCSN